MFNMNTTLLMALVVLLKREEQNLNKAPSNYGQTRTIKLEGILYNLSIKYRNLSLYIDMISYTSKPLLITVKVHL